MKQVKRAKSAKVIIVNSVTCPHCKTECKGFSESALRIRCFYCANEIILKWE